MASRINLAGPYVFLIYDHGLGQGPENFKSRPKSADPAHVIDLAKKGRFTALGLEPGIARLYKDEIRAANVPLIVKINGRTKFSPDAFFAPQLCSVEYAIENLHADAIGAVVFLGDDEEPRMLENLGRIAEAVSKYETSERHIPIIGWMYHVEDYSTGGVADPKRTAYAARIGAELGCNIVKVHWTGDKESFSWVCQAAGSKTEIVIAGGIKTDSPEEFLDTAREAKEAGAKGVAVGRNIWQAPQKEALYITESLHEIFSSS